MLEAQPITMFGRKITMVVLFGCALFLGISAGPFETEEHRIREMKSYYQDSPVFTSDYYLMEEMDEEASEDSDSEDEDETPSRSPSINGYYEDEMASQSPPSNGYDEDEMASQSPPSDEGAAHPQQGAS